MQEATRRRLRVLFSFLFSAALMLIYFAFQRVSYVVNDDLMMVRTLEGYAGQQVTFNMYLHPAVTALVSGLSRIFPQGHWFTWLLMVSQLIAFAAITKCTA
ncbi:MAG: hypothetical protein Q4C54_07315 [Clostridia bacterium]|nr:hypothetical protein [Clostridia bacterium]